MRYRHQPIGGKHHLSVYWGAIEKLFHFVVFISLVHCASFVNIYKAVKNHNKPELLENSCRGSSFWIYQLLWRAAFVLAETASFIFLSLLIMNQHRMQNEAKAYIAGLLPPPPDRCQHMPPTTAASPKDEVAD